MKVITLVENYTCQKGITAQHGLSLYIETNSKKILFDMGQNELFEKNAMSLNVDISSVDVAILSHGHYDHGGGAMHFLNMNKTSPLYINKNSFCDFFSKNGYIGLNKELSSNPRVVQTECKTEIYPFATLYMGEDVSQKEKSFSGGLKKSVGNVIVDDDFIHEQYLLIEENGKRILFSGCSHRGILNIIECFKPDVFFGGFHLNSLGYESDELRCVAEKLLKYNTVFYTCHCTGIESYSFLKTKLKANLNYLNSGKCVEI